MTKQIPLTKGKFALVDDEDYELLNKSKWCYGSGAYALNRKLGFMHRLIMNTPKGMSTDHINGNGLDNRKENLRICTHSQNMMNTTRFIGKLKYKGAVYDKLRNKYYCEITLNKKRVFIGRYKTEIEAAMAYNEAAVKYFGEFARLNVIEDN